MVMAGCASTPQNSDDDFISEINQQTQDYPSALGGGTKYYVCDDGSDINNGLSAFSPWKTFEKGMTQFNAMNAGDSILFCRGGVFPVNGSPRLYNPKCRVSEPCSISDYEKDSLANREPPTISMQHKSVAFNFQDGGNADHDEGYIVENLDIKGLGKEAGIAVFFYNDVDHVLLRNLRISDFKVGVQVAGTNTPNPGANNINEMIVADNVVAYDVGGPFYGPGTIEGDIINENTNVSRRKARSGSIFVCDDGSDDNSGDSPFSPWKTFDKAMSQFNHLDAGEGVYFCRGGTFYVENTHRLMNENCNAEMPCLIADYFSNNSITDERPKIISESGKVVFNFQNPGDAVQDGGYVVQNLSLESYKYLQAAIFLYNDVDDLQVRNLRIDGFKFGIHSAGANTPKKGSNRKNERIIISHSEIINNSDQGWLGACSDCILDGNLFDNNGFSRRVFNHNIYFSGKTDDENIIISNNILKNNAIVNGLCSGASFVMHGHFKNIKIENNLIEEQKGKAEMGCWGISVDPGYSQMEESFYGLVIKGNKIINAGGVGIGCASCVDVLIEGNDILNAQDLNTTGIAVPVRKEDLVTSDNVIIRNNNVALVNDGANKIGFRTKETVMAVLSNNKVYSSGSDVRCSVVDGTEVIDLDGCYKTIQ